MPIFMVTLRDRSERPRVWMETEPSIYEIPFVTRRRDKIGRFWLVGLEEYSWKTAVDAALYMISTEKVRRQI